MGRVRVHLIARNEVVFTIRQLGLGNEDSDRDCRMVEADLARRRLLLE